MLGSGVDLELPDQPTAELVLREHSPDSKLDGPPWVAVEQLAVGHRLQATGPARVSTGELVGALVSGESDLGRVHHNHEVTAVDMRRESWLVLAAQQGRRRYRQPAEHDIIGIDDMPGPGDVARLRAVGGHNRLPS